MKLHLHQSHNLYTISSHGPGFFKINDVCYNKSLIVHPQEEPTFWPISNSSSLNANNLRDLIKLNAEIVIIGTGARHQILHPSILSPLLEAKIGIEVMNTPAACRTFNILTSEGRNIVAALMLT